MKHLLFLLAFILLSFGSAIAGKESARLKAFYAAVDGGNIQQASTFLSPSVKAYLPYSPEPMDLKGFTGVGYALKSAIPDMLHHLDEITTGERVIGVRGRLTGHNTQSFMGLPAKGNFINSPFQGYYYFDAKGLIREVHILFDRISFERQLTGGEPPQTKASELTRQLFDQAIGGQHDLALLDHLLSDDFTSSAFPVPDADKLQFIEGIRSVHKAFPDLAIFVSEQLAEGSRVFTAGYFEATHRDIFMGIPATGKRVKVNFIDIWKEREGKLYRNEVVMDMAGLMDQISPAETAENKRKAEAIMKSVASGNLDEVLMHCQPDARFYGFAPGTLDGQGYKRTLQDLFKAFPDYRFSLYDFIGEGDLVVARHQFDGTHSGSSFQGIPPTGRKVTIPATATIKFNDGKVTEIWLNMYVLSIMDQLKNPGVSGN